MSSEQVLYKLILIKARRAEEESMQRESKTSRAIELERFDGSWDDDCSRYEDHLYTLRYARRSDETLSTHFIKKLHALCFPYWEHPGEFRPTIGRVSIQNSDFTPTAGWKVEQEIETWCGSWAWFLSRDENPFIVLANLHIQFERIHPFRDGNGRIGRILVNYMAAQLGRGVIALLPGDRQKYIDLLRDQDVRGLASLFERRELR